MKILRIQEIDACACGCGDLNEAGDCPCTQYNVGSDCRIDQLDEKYL